MIRVLIVDDHALVRTGYRLILQGAAEIEVIADTESGEEGVRLARELKPQVILMDIHLPGISGLEAARRIQHYAPECRVIAVTAQVESPYPRQFIETGAAGYLTKNCPKEELIQAIRTVAAGSRFISQQIAQAMAIEAMNGVKRSPFEILSRREMEIVIALAGGDDMPTIAARLHLAPKTVASHKYNVFRKLEIDNDVALTHLAIQHGLVDSAKPKGAR